MIKNFKEKLIYFIIFLVAFSLLEMVSNIFMFNFPFNRYFYGEILIAGVLGSFILLFKHKSTVYVYLDIILLLLTILLVVNAHYFLIFGDIFSLQYLTLVGEGLNVMSADFLKWNIILTSFGIFLAFTLMPVILKRIKLEGVKIKKRSLSFLLSALALVILSFSALQIDSQIEKSKYSNETVENVTLAKTYNYSKFGMLNYYMKEIKALTFEDRLSTKSLKEALKKTSTSNDYTGIYKDYNVIEIMVETGVTEMVNEYLTPNLYEMYTKGIGLNRNISKNKTNVSEMIGITGSYPSTGLSNLNIDVPYSLPSMLNDDYRTIYFHDTGANRDIYSRKKLIPSLGFKEAYFHEDLWPNKEIWNWGGNYTLDSETVLPLLDLMLNDTSKPIYTYFTTLSMHGPYYNSGNESLLSELYGDKYSEAVSKGYYTNPLKGTRNEACMSHYMMASMDFDKALGSIIEALKAKNIYDKTLFVIYGDHDIYYNGVDGKPISYSLTGLDSLDNYQLYETLNLFYAPGMNLNIELPSITSPYVIVPTILDLLGKKYYTNLYPGTSLFNPDLTSEEVFYSLELSSFFNDHYYSDGVDITKTFNEGDLSLFKQKTAAFLKKQLMLDKIYSQNIFGSFIYPKLS